MIIKVEKTILIPSVPAIIYLALPEVWDVASVSCHGTILRDDVESS